jgi:hypothetical protein
VKRKLGTPKAWKVWLTETFVLLARYQAPEQKDEIMPQARRCPLRTLLPARPAQKKTT